MNIFVSRHRLMQCPACHVHIRMAVKLDDTVCPFCDATVSGARPGSGPMRSGVAAGAVLALSVLSGCEVQPVYGAPAPDVAVVDVAGEVNADTAADVGPTPVYGTPADFERP